MKQNPDKKSDEVNMTGDPKQKGWYDQKTDKVIPYEEMSNSMLAKAYHLCQMREFAAFKQCCRWSERADKLREEAERRGQKLKDFDTNYHAQKKHTRENVKDERVGS